MEDKTKITKDDILSNWDHYLDYLVEILNKDYPLESAIEDIRGLIGSEFDPRYTKSDDLSESRQINNYNNFLEGI